MGGEGADFEIAADLVGVAGGHGDEFVGGGLAFDFAPASEDGIDGADDFAGQEDFAGLHALEVALGEVVGEAGDVVHVAVRDAGDVAGESEVGGAADVEADVELGDLDEGFFAGDAVADHVELAERDAGEFLNEKRFVRCLVRH